MLYKFRNLFYIILLITISVIIHFQWFNPFSILTAGDWNYIPNSVVSSLHTTWNSWIPLTNFGNVNIQLPFLFFMSIWSLIVNTGFNSDIATKITLFIPIAILNFISPYILSKHIFNNKLISFTLAIFYGTTTYGIVNQVPIHFVYALSPLIFYLFILALELQKLKNWFLFVLSYSIGIYYEVRIMYILSFILLVFLLFFYQKIIFSFRKFAILVFCSILIILLNLFWVFPLLFGSGSSSVAVVANRGLFGNNLFDLTHAFTIFGWYWTGGKPDVDFKIQPIIWYFWFIPIFAFVPLLKVKRYSRKIKLDIIFYAFISLIGILLTKQSSFPFLNLYQWLYNNFPGFVIFREASKFYIITTIGYLGLLGYLLKNIIDSSFKYKLFFFNFLVSIIIVTSFINTIPLLNGQIGGLFINRKIPNDYIILNKYLETKSKEGFFRTYWIPRDSHWGYFGSSTPKISGIDIINAAWSQFILREKGNLIEEDIVNVFEHSYSEQLFNQSAIRYLIVPLKDTLNDNDFFIHYGNNRNFFISKINEIDQWQKIDVGTENIDVYENKYYSNYINSFEKLEGYSNSSNIQNKYLLASSTFNTNNFNFIVSNSEIKIPGRYIIPLFEKNSLNELISGEKINIEGNNDIKIIANQNDKSLYYQFINDRIIFSTGFKNNLYNNDGALKFPETRRNISSFQVEPGKDYFLNSNLGILTLTPQNLPTFLGTLINPELYSLDRNVEMEKLITPSNFVAKINNNIENNIQSISLQNRDSYTFKYIDENYKQNNVVPNPSFEEGTWNETVGDCNHYDDKQDISMYLSEESKTDGKFSLQLEARKHIACSSIEIKNLISSRNYLLSFDYQDETNNTAGYYLGFTGTTTYFSERIPIFNNSWNTYSKIITIPDGVSKGTLAVYAYESNGSLKNTTRYDNFKLISLPGDVNKYSLLAQNDFDIKKPSDIKYTNLLPTKKMVHVQGATTPFYLSMSEAYHDQWQLEMNNGKIHGVLSSWWPWAKPDAVSQDYHFKLNDFLNGWYVDTNDLCVVKKYEGCTQNPDGSWNLDMVIEFTPQRWFYIGLIISGTTLAAILGYLGYDLVKRIRIRRQKSQGIDEDLTQKKSPRNIQK